MIRWCLDWVWQEESHRGQLSQRDRLPHQEYDLYESPVEQVRGVVLAVAMLDRAPVALENPRQRGLQLYLSLGGA